jgi:7-carboxy-7-deazaguanine synthase
LDVIIFWTDYFCEIMAEVAEKPGIPRKLIGVLPVMERFYTIQGEGRNTGEACFFIRLGGCDVGCHWCDVKESWDAEAHPMVSIEELLKEVTASGAPAVVVTGGEPCMYDLAELTAVFKARNIRTYIETSGSWKITGDWDWICVSPKKFKKPLESALLKAHELKVVLFNRHDLKWAEENAALVSSQCMLYLQPEWSKRELITPLIVEYVKSHPAWKISLQTHKYIDIP